ncbi:cupredoxin domain-containing protein [Natronorarus salvus]|uniref:hypothetical protein n=1 Tax=Natronorarus salvus TaxID=3117733 RepID=UPI002F265D2B
MSATGCIQGDDEPEEEDDESEVSEDSWHSRVDFEGDVDQEIYVEARSYEFSPGSDEPVTVSLDDQVGLAMTSLDDGYHMGHGFGIETYGVEVEATRGAVDSTVFLADEPGEFEIRCTVPCSDGHTGMTGTFLVEE